MLFRSHSRCADLDVSPDLYTNPGRAQRMGNALGKRNQHAGKQTHLVEKDSARLDLLSLGLPATQMQLRFDFLDNLLRWSPQFDCYCALVRPRFFQIGELAS